MVQVAGEALEEAEALALAASVEEAAEAFRAVAPAADGKEKSSYAFKLTHQR